MDELISQLTGQLNVDDKQAKGGVGLILNFAKEQLAGGDFSQVTNALGGGAEEAMDEAPSTGGGAMGLLGGLASSLGGDLGDKAEGLLKLKQGFEKLGIDDSMIAKFAPIVIEFIEAKAGPQVANLLKGLIK